MSMFVKFDSNCSCGDLDNYTPSVKSLLKLGFEQNESFEYIYQKSIEEWDVYIEYDERKNEFFIISSKDNCLFRIEVMSKKYLKGLIKILSKGSNE